MKQKFDITGMTCAACQSHVFKSVSKLPGVTNCEVNLLTNSMNVIYEEDKCSNEIIISAVKEAGYGASIYQKKKNHKKNKDLNKLIVSFLFFHGAYDKFAIT